MWKPFEIQAFNDWDPALSEQIEEYLEQKESHLAREVLRIIPVVEGDTTKPDLSGPEDERIRINEAIDAIAERLRKVHGQAVTPLTHDVWIAEVRKLNQAFWEYIEVLEGAVSELFQQTALIGLEKWEKPLFDGVTKVKEILICRIEDITWAIRRLENHLKEYRYLVETNGAKNAFWKRWLIWWQPVLDPALLINLSKSEKFCKSSYCDFVEHFEGYRSLASEVAEYGKKFANFTVLNTLDEGRGELFVNLTTSLRLWDENQKKKAFPQTYAIRSLKQLSRPEPILALLHEYHKALSETIFSCSRQLKKEKVAASEQAERKKALRDELIHFRKEVRTLVNTAAKYRNFLLRTDPDPYVRSRWGFTEWIVGPEPAITRKFLNEAFEAKDLKSLLDHFIKTLADPTPKFTAFKRSSLYQQIEYTLHEMSQPLNTQEMMEKRCETLLEYLLEINELITTDWAYVDYITDVLVRAFRDDWRYHVLQEGAPFRKVYTIHEGILGKTPSLFERLPLPNIKKIAARFERTDTLSYHEDIEAEINDLRAALQDFYVAAQKAPRQEVEQALLHYHVLIGPFLYKNGQKNLDGQPLRTVFFFIDHYLEAIHKLLD